MLTACHHFAVVVLYCMGPDIGFLSSAPEHDLELMSASRHDVEILVGKLTKPKLGNAARSSGASRPDATTRVFVQESVFNVVSQAVRLKSGPPHGKFPHKRR